MEKQGNIFLIPVIVIAVTTIIASAFGKNTIAWALFSGFCGFWVGVDWVTSWAKKNMVPVEKPALLSERSLPPYMQKGEVYRILSTIAPWENERTLRIHCLKHVNESARPLSPDDKESPIFLIRTIDTGLPNLFKVREMFIRGGGEGNYFEERRFTFEPPN